MTLDEAVKTVQLKREIDSLLDSRIDDLSSGCSSGAEDGEHHQENNVMSPMSFEKLRAEKKY